MTGYGVGPGALDGLASRLRNGASDLEGGASKPPPSPEAGEITTVVTGLVGALSTSLAGVVEGVGAAGDALITSRDAYETAEQDARADVEKAGPR